MLGIELTHSGQPENTEKARTGSIPLTQGNRKIFPQWRQHFAKTPNPALVLRQRRRAAVPPNGLQRGRIELFTCCARMWKNHLQQVSAFFTIQPRLSYVSNRAAADAAQQGIVEL